MISEQEEQSVFTAVSLCDWMARCSLKAFTWSLFVVWRLRSSSYTQNLRKKEKHRMYHDKNVLHLFCQIFEFSFFLPYSAWAQVYRVFFFFLNQFEFLCLELWRLFFFYFVDYYSSLCPIHGRLHTGYTNTIYTEYSPLWFLVLVSWKLLWLSSDGYWALKWQHQCFWQKM